MQNLKVYLAGPDVFLPDPKEEKVVEEKKAICAEAGFTAVNPADNNAPQDAMAISRENERLMDICDLLIANMTPFRGPSMDVGTAYEMGYMRGRGKPVFGYSNDSRSYLEKVKSYVPLTKAADEADVRLRADGKTYEDNKAMAVENFKLLDNLMVEGAIQANGSQVFVPKTPMTDCYGEPGAFRQAVAAAKIEMQRREATAMDEERRKLLIEEWRVCRTTLGEFDKTLVDIRRYGFSLVTILLSATGFLFADLGGADFAKVGIYFALLVLIVGLFRQDRVHEVFIRSAVLRAMDIESDLRTGISFRIAYWSGRLKTGTWGEWLYYSFCGANFVLVFAGVTAAEFLSNPDLQSSLNAIKLNCLSLSLCVLGLIAALWSIWVEHRKSKPLNDEFTRKVNEHALAAGFPAIDAET